MSSSEEQAAKNKAKVLRRVQQRRDNSSSYSSSGKYGGVSVISEVGVGLTGIEATREALRKCVEKVEVRGIDAATVEAITKVSYLYTICSIHCARPSVSFSAPPSCPSVRPP